MKFGMTGTANTIMTTVPNFEFLASYMYLSNTFFNKEVLMLLLLAIMMVAIIIRTLQTHSTSLCCYSVAQKLHTVASLQHNSYSFYAN